MPECIAILENTLKLFFALSGIDAPLFNVFFFAKIRTDYVVLRMQGFILPAPLKIGYCTCNLAAYAA